MYNILVVKPKFGYKPLGIRRRLIWLKPSNMVCRTFIGQRFQRDDCIHRFAAADSGAARRHYCRLCNGDALAAHLHHCIYREPFADSLYFVIHPLYLPRTEKTPLHSLVEWCERKADAKVTKSENTPIGGLSFRCPALPGTGAWMGALISALLHMDPKKTFPVIMVGVLTAGMIVSVLSFGILGNII